MSEVKKKTKKKPETREVELLYNEEESSVFMWQSKSGEKIELGGVKETDNVLSIR